MSPSSRADTIQAREQEQHDATNMSLLRSSSGTELDVPVRAAGKENPEVVSPPASGRTSPTSTGRSIDVNSPEYVPEGLDERARKAITQRLEMSRHMYVPGSGFGPASPRTQPRRLLLSRAGIDAAAKKDRLSQESTPPSTHRPNGMHVNLGEILGAESLQVALMPSPISKNPRVERNTPEESFVKVDGDDGHSFQDVKIVRVQGMKDVVTEVCVREGSDLTGGSSNHDDDHSPIPSNEASDGSQDEFSTLDQQQQAIEDAAEISSSDDDVKVNEALDQALLGQGSSSNVLPTSYIPSYAQLTKPQQMAEDELQSQLTTHAAASAKAHSTDADEDSRASMVFSGADTEAIQRDLAKAFGFKDGFKQAHAASEPVPLRKSRRQTFTEYSSTKSNEGLEKFKRKRPSSLFIAGSNFDPPVNPALIMDPVQREAAQKRLEQQGRPESSHLGGFSQRAAHRPEAPRAASRKDGGHVEIFVQINSPGQALSDADDSSVTSGSSYGIDGSTRFRSVAIRKTYLPRDFVNSFSDLGYLIFAKNPEEIDVEVQSAFCSKARSHFFSPAMAVFASQMSREGNLVKSANDLLPCSSLPPVVTDDNGVARRSFAHNLDDVDIVSVKMFCDMLLVHAEKFARDPAPIDIDAQQWVDGPFDATNAEHAAAVWPSSLNYVMAGCFQDSQITTYLELLRLADFMRWSDFTVMSKHWLTYMFTDGQFLSLRGEHMHSEIGRWRSKINSMKRGKENYDTAFVFIEAFLDGLAEGANWSEHTSLNLHDVIETSSEKSIKAYKIAKSSDIVDIVATKSAGKWFGRGKIGKVVPTLPVTQVSTASSSVHASGDFTSPRKLQQTEGAPREVHATESCPRAHTPRGRLLTPPTRFGPDHDPEAFEASLRSIDLAAEKQKSANKRKRAESPAPSSSVSDSPTPSTRSMPSLTASPASQSPSSSMSASPSDRVRRVNISPLPAARRLSGSGMTISPSGSCRRLAESVMRSLKSAVRRTPSSDSDPRWNSSNNVDRGLFTPKSSGRGIERTPTLGVPPSANSKAHDRLIGAGVIRSERAPRPSRTLHPKAFKKLVGDDTNPDQLDEKTFAMLVSKESHHEEVKQQESVSTPVRQLKQKFGSVIKFNEIVSFFKFIFIFFVQIQNYGISFRRNSAPEAGMVTAWQPDLENSHQAQFFQKHFGVGVSPDSVIDTLEARNPGGNLQKIAKQLGAGVHLDAEGNIVPDDLTPVHKIGSTLFGSDQASRCV